MKPLIGITIGDPGGIGPEVCVKALSSKKCYEKSRPILIGDAQIIQNAIEFCDLDIGINIIDEPSQGLYQHGKVDIIDLNNMPLDKLRLKEVTAQQGDASFSYVAKAIDLAMNNKIDATVTGPINKEAINLAGHHFSGHTEIYAHLTNTKKYSMMLADGSFRISHVSTHVSLREACDRAKKERVMSVIELTHKALLQLGISEPKVAVAGLNPHCGESGLFGNEDQEEIVPAIEECRKNNIHAEGPIPADTIFVKMKGGQYDAVVAMYHDQGHIPMKLNGFQYDSKTDTWGNLSGINITLGLPIIRTSVDHGTAFDKAGENRANEQSMVDAIYMACDLYNPKLF